MAAIAARATELLGMNCSACPRRIWRAMRTLWSTARMPSTRPARQKSGEARFLLKKF